VTIVTALIGLTSRDINGPDPIMDNIKSGPSDQDQGETAPLLADEED
jgi:hypothetical protein